MNNLTLILNKKEKNILIYEYIMIRNRIDKIDCN
jgi:hypothetical protein